MGYVTEAMLEKVFKRALRKQTIFFREMLRQELAPIKEKLAEHDEKFNQITIVLDGIMKTLAIHTAELAAIKNRLDRHEGWIKGIAEHVGYQLKVSEKRSVYKVNRRTRRRSSIGRAAVS